MFINVYVTQSYGADVSIEFKNNKRTVVELTAQEAEDLYEKLALALRELHENTMSTVRRK